MSTTAETSGSLFTAISTSAPPSMFTRKSNPVAIPSGVTTSGPLQTNNFFGNMLVGDQKSPVFTHPYVVWMTSSGYTGLSISHQTDSQKVFGPTDTEGTASYFYSAAGVQSVVLSSADFSSGFTFKINSPKRFSVNARFQSNTVSDGYLECPLVQGMGFITGVYYDLIPQIYSAVGFTSVTGGTAPRTGTQKYVLNLNDGSVWVMYVTLPNKQSVSFKLKNSNTIIASNSLNGAYIQIGCGNNSAYDSAAGCYPTAATLSGSVSGSTGKYALQYATSGSSNGGTTIMYALPHHVASFTSTTSGKATSLTLDDTVHGKSTAYLTNVFEMSESLPTSVGLDPWSSISGFSAPTYSSSELTAIANAAATDIKANVSSASNLDSMYYSGKILDKYAYVLYVLYYVLKDTEKTKTFLEVMKTAMNRFTQNKQTNPLDYDTVWGGIVSDGGMGGDSSVDFGNKYYNDHHFHYGYHVHAAAIIATVDAALGGNWGSTNKDWVNNLIRDYSNPSSSDKYFPVLRNFDFYNGHSFAHGITAYADGKDEESSSEDYNATYGMKIWAKFIGDKNMENRANLMLAITKRSMNTYFLYKSSNTVMPSKFVGNKVSGILFENKIDHTTYFGTNLEYIHGIHMLPITPISSFIRDSTFVKEEWDQVLSSIIGNVTSGWKGILMLNVALYDPGTAYNFFNGSSFSTNYLDDGMSLTWALTYCAAVKN